jgi:hypothetical protein
MNPNVLYPYYCIPFIIIESDCCGNTQRGGTLFLWRREEEGFRL